MLCISVELIYLATVLVASHVGGTMFLVNKRKLCAGANVESRRIHF